MYQLIYSGTMGRLVRDTDDHDAARLIALAKSEPGRWEEAFINIITARVGVTIWSDRCGIRWDEDGNDKFV